MPRKRAQGRGAQGRGASLAGQNNLRSQWGPVTQMFMKRKFQFNYSLTPKEIEEDLTAINAELPRQKRSIASSKYSLPKNRGRGRDRMRETHATLPSHTATPVAPPSSGAAAQPSSAGAAPPSILSPQHTPATIIHQSSQPQMSHLAASQAADTQDQSVWRRSSDPAAQQAAAGGHAQAQDGGAQHQVGRLGHAMSADYVKQKELSNLQSNQNVASPQVVELLNTISQGAYARHIAADSTQSPIVQGGTQAKGAGGPQNGVGVPPGGEDKGEGGEEQQDTIRAAAPSDTAPTEQK